MFKRFQFTNYLILLSIKITIPKGFEVIFILKERKKVNSNNDPSAGSPTNTLLRLLLPLFGKVHSNSPQQTRSTRK